MRRRRYDQEAGAATVAEFRQVTRRIEYELQGAGTGASGGHHHLQARRDADALVGVQHFQRRGLLLAIVVPGPRTVSETAALARVAPPLMSGGARACQLAGIVMPGGRWLGLRFLAAERRARQHDRSL